MKAEFNETNIAVENKINQEQTYYKGKDAIKAKTSFALGGMVMNMPWILVGSFLMYFLTDIALVPALSVSGLFLAVRVFDGINDPIIGVMADRTKSRFGRYRPWMLTGGLLLIPTVILLFWAHPDWSVGARTAYASVLYVIAVIAATMWDIPYGGLNACITPYSKERASFATSRILVSSVASAIGAGIFLPLMNRFGGNQGDPGRGYLVATAIVCLIALPFIFITFFGTKEVINPPKGQKLSPKALIQTVSKNPPLLIILSGFFIYGFMNFGRGAVGMYYFSYNWNQPNLFSVFIFLTGILSGLAAFSGMYVLKFVKSKRNACLLGFILMAATSLIALFLTPENSSSTIVLIVLWISSAANGLVTGMIYAMIPDTVEFGQWKSGIRADGFIYAASSFMMKLGGAVSPALLGVLLQFSGYIPGGVQPEITLKMINGTMNLMPAILATIAAVIFYFYKLDDELHSKILVELSEREEELIK